MALENDDAYTAKTWVCHGCAARARAADRVADVDSRALSYTYFTTTRR